MVSSPLDFSFESALIRAVMRDRISSATSSTQRTPGRRPSYSIDVVLFTPRGKQLAVLCERARDPRARERWQLPIAWIEGDETLESAARRAATASVGAEPTWIAQVGAFGDGLQHPADVELSVAFVAVVPAAKLERTSSDAALFGAQDDFGARWLQSRMTALVGVPFGNGEHMVVLSYEPGQEYRPHYDYLPAAARGNKPEPDQPGQRVHTMFCFLDDVAGGGATDFPQLGVSVAPKRGRLVHFTNLLADGSGDPATLHAGLPVTAGRKWLATMWTRQRRYRYW